MKLIATTFFFLLLCSTICVAQNKSALDERNGFKDFHLGDSKSKWISSLIVNDSSKKSNIYDYKGTCCNTFFLQEINKISLEFSEGSNQLDFISLKLKNELFQFQLEMLLESITKEFGEVTKINAFDDMVTTYLWDGDKVRLGVTIFRHPKEDTEDMFGISVFYLTIASTKDY